MDLRTAISTRYYWKLITAALRVFLVFTTWGDRPEIKFWSQKHIQHLMFFFRHLVTKKYNTCHLFKVHFLKNTSKKKNANPSPRSYLLYMRFPYLSCEITWPQGRPRGPSQGAPGPSPGAPWAGPRAAAQGSRARAAALGPGLGPAHGAPGLGPGAHVPLPLTRTPCAPVAM